MEALQLKNRNILVVGAHPDDNDFIAGGMVAQAAKEGSTVVYLVATRGDRGSSDNIKKEELMKRREEEQKNAGLALGVSAVEFLEHKDGEVKADIGLKEDVVRCIRKYKPDMVVTMDPAFIYSAEYGFVNHTDHRNIGEAVMDAVYPLARDKLSFQHHEEEGLTPHTVQELCFGASFSKERINTYADITESFEQKIQALTAHQSQIQDVDALRERLLEQATENGKVVGCKLAETFIRISFNR